MADKRRKFGRVTKDQSTEKRRIYEWKGIWTELEKRWNRKVVFGHVG